MTGHGEARCCRGAVGVTVEVRTINGRHFKLSVRGLDGSSWLEAQIEQVVRRYVRRGTVHVAVALEREPTADDYRVNQAVLAGYVEQLQRLADRLQLDRNVSLAALLALPGVVTEREAAGEEVQQDWPLVEQTLVKSLEQLHEMRTREGEAMAQDLLANCDAITAALEQIEQRAPQVVEAYRQRLRERLTQWMAEFDLQVEQAELLREVALFADRSDISEEIVRLRSHLDQFRAVMTAADSSGRKLDFLTQEMFRETNTIGSKANDVEIARHVIEIKTAIERMREMVQNIE